MQVWFYLMVSIKPDGHISPDKNYIKLVRTGHQVAPSQNWSSLIKVDLVCWGLIQFDPEWYSLIQVIPVWSSLVQFDPFVTRLIKFDQVWSSLIQFDPVWSSLVQFDQVWSSLIKLGPVWSSLTMLDHVWLIIPKFLRRSLSYWVMPKTTCGPYGFANGKNVPSWSMCHPLVNS